jgi:hypothetical protein
MTHTIFFSWQSDTPSEWGRNFIERALTAAKEKLLEDLTVEPAIRDAGIAVDRDTRDISGTPPIVDTIFKKIDSACAFVVDITFVGKRLDGRLSPNPNVLVEYGWALKSRGYTRIITLMNTAYGEPSDETLPFNMKHLRWPIAYYLPEGADDATKRKARSDLAEKLRVALKAIIGSEEFKASIPKPPEVPKFAERLPVNGPARFKGLEEPIGIIDGLFGIGGNREVTLAAGPAIWLRVMPDRQQARQWTIPELRDGVSRGGKILLPFGSFSGFSYIRSADGFGYVPSMAHGGDPVPAVILAFKSGEVWSVYVGPLLLLHDTLPNMEAFFVEGFIRCVFFLRDALKIDLPYRWIAGMEGMKGKKMQRIAPPGSGGYMEQFTGVCLEDLVMEKGLLNASDAVQLGLRDFFRKLYDAFGSERPDHMDEILTRQFPQ